MKGGIKGDDGVKTNTVVELMSVAVSKTKSMTEEDITKTQPTTTPQQFSKPQTIFLTIVLLLSYLVFGISAMLQAPFYPSAAEKKGVLPSQLLLSKTLQLLISTHFEK